MLSQAAQVAENPLELEKHKKLLTKLKEDSASPKAISHLESAFGASLANQKLVREFFAPVGEYLERHQGEEGALALFTSYPSGWPVDRYLPYFYRDWYGTEEASRVAKLFCDAIQDYSGAGNQSVAVLGCGACGLAYSVSELFSTTFGIDISVPALLLANHLLNGGEAVLHFNLPHDRFPKVQRRVKLCGPPERHAGINLIASDVNNLPFASESVSCINTQYLLDLVNDQKALAAEIHRVLVPGGLWINLGLPSSLTAFDVPTHLDLPEFFGQTGFDALDVSVRRMEHLDFSGIDEWKSKVIHSNLFFVARKNQSRSYKGQSHFAQYFAGKAESFWSKVPSLSERFTFSISQERQFSSEGTREKKLLEIQTAGGDLPGMSSLLRTDISSEGAGFLNQSLQAIDGSRTLREIVEILHGSLGGVVAEREVILFLKALHNSRFMVLPTDDIANGSLM
jgi:SAM-dependent methyltransferase